MQREIKLSLQDFRSHQLRDLTNEIGVYALCGLDAVPIYVGQSTDGIRSRVRRHLTSARSDVIANRQLDVWEVAFVWGYPKSNKAKISELEAYLITEFHNKRPLMQGDIPPPVKKLSFKLPEKQVIQIMPTEEIEKRLNPVLRLPRQAEFFYLLVDHIMNVKESEQQRRTLQAHHERLTRYYGKFLSA